MFTVAQLHLYSIYTAFEITILDIKHMFYTYVDTVLGAFRKTLLFLQNSYTVL